jgi:hypothetical protein
MDFFGDWRLERALGGGYVGPYIGGNIKSGPSDQTDLEQRRRLNLGGGGKPTYEEGLTCGTHRPASLVVGPASPPVSLLARSSVSYLLDASRVFLSRFRRG